MKQLLTRLFDYGNLTKEESMMVMQNIAKGKYNDEQIASFITVYLMRAITLDELLGFREALLSTAQRIDFSDYETIDIVGTGGDGKNTFNISTLACFVVAGLGYKVTKHGNYGASSISGASNVLEYLGVRFTTKEDVLRRSLDCSNMAFLHAPLFNPAMKRVAPIRKSLAVRTFFNVLGPLISPIQPKYQMLGVYSLTMLRLYNYISQQTGQCFALVHSLDGYDEVSLTSSVKILTNNQELVLEPSDFGSEKLCQNDIFGGNSIEEAACIFRKILNNEATLQQKNVVIANSAIALQLLNSSLSLDDAVLMARESIDSGKAKEAFLKFLEINS
ncbi:MAG: anthranilate phosphoribosyltransferase [Paludibacteraceae bacterium]|nr:anthranilate phosphoribosyltransferase [Paludibacteraceae bacterium]